MNRFWTKEEFIKAVKLSTSIGEVLKCFELPENRGSYYHKLFHKSIKELNLSTSHFKPFRNSTFKKIATEELFVDGIFRSTTCLKKRIIKEGLLEQKCSLCKMEPFWNGKTLTLQLDHINGDNTDNKIENLRLLCPNCHSQTETFSGAKAKKEKHKHKFVCKLCLGPKKSSSSEVCLDCTAKVLSGKFKINWPEVQTVLNMLETNSCNYVAKELGVTDNAVRKFLKRNGIDPKTLQPFVKQNTDT